MSGVSAIILNKTEVYSIIIVELENSFKEEA